MKLTSQHSRMRSAKFVIAVLAAMWLAWTYVYIIMAKFTITVLEGTPDTLWVDLAYLLQRCGFGRYSEWAARFMMADNLLTHSLLWFPAILIVFVEIASWEKQRADVSARLPSIPHRDAQMAFALVAMFSVFLQGMALILDLPAVIIDGEAADATRTGRYYLPSENMASTGVVHCVLLCLSPLSVLVAIACVIALLYGLTRSLMRRVIGAFAAVIVVPFVASVGLSISVLLPESALLVPWAALVLWFLAVGIGVYLVFRPPSCVM